MARRFTRRSLAVLAVLVVAAALTACNRTPPEQRLLETAEALQDALISDFGLQPGSFFDQAGLKRLSLVIFERTFTVTAALNVL